MLSHASIPANMKGAQRRQVSRGRVQKVHCRSFSAHRRLGAHTLPDLICANCQHVHAEDALRRVNAALEEQARSIGQALHDEAGQLLTAAFNALAEAMDLVPPVARTPLDAIKRYLDAIEKQIRQVAHELRPRILDDLGLAPALRFLADGLSIRRSVSVTLAVGVAGPLPAPVETAVYRVVQESITNISKHANARHVSVTVEERPGLLTCRIHDDGVGIKPLQPPGSGLGLIGMHHRVRALGGTLIVDSASDRGTELTAIIPLEKRDVRTRAAR